MHLNTCSQKVTSRPFLEKSLVYFLYQSINQSINQISIALMSPAKPGSVVRQPNQCATAKSRKLSVTSTGHRACRYLLGKGQVEKMCLQIFVKGSN